jgi:hypothetical protein
MSGKEGKGFREVQGAPLLALRDKTPRFGVEPAWGFNFLRPEGARGAD